MSNRPRSRGKKTLESGSTGTKKGRGRGRGRVNNKQSALNEEDNLMQGGKGKKRKKNSKFLTDSLLVLGLFSVEPLDLTALFIILN